MRRKFAINALLLRSISFVSGASFPDDSVKGQMVDQNSMSNVPQMYDSTFHVEAPPCWLKAYEKVEPSSVIFDSSTGNWVFSNKTSETLFTMNLIQCIGVGDRVFKQGGGSINNHPLINSSSSDVLSIPSILASPPEMLVTLDFHDVVGELIYDEVFMQADFLFTTIYNQKSYARRMGELSLALQALENKAYEVPNRSIYRAFKSFERNSDCNDEKYENVLVHDTAEFEALINSIFSLNGESNGQPKVPLGSPLEVQMHQLSLLADAIEPLLAVWFTTLSWMGHVLQVPAKVLLIFVISSSQHTRPLRFKLLLVLFFRFALEGYMSATPTILKEMRNDLMDIIDKLLELCLGVLLCYVVLRRRDLPNRFEITDTRMEGDGNCIIPSNRYTNQHDSIIYNRQPDIQSNNAMKKIPPMDDSMVMSKALIAPNRARNYRAQMNTNTHSYIAFENIDNINYGAEKRTQTSDLNLSRENFHEDSLDDQTDDEEVIILRKRKRNAKFDVELIDSCLVTPPPRKIKRRDN